MDEQLFQKIVKNLVELKDTSELMMDLAYSSLLLESRELAEEVMRLEDHVDTIHHEFQLFILSYEGAEKEAESRLGLIEIGEVAERIADASADIAKVVLRGLELHPVIGLAIREAEETVVKAIVSKNSPLVGRALKESKVAERTGMWILVVLRGNSWLRPTSETIIQSGDTLIASGYAKGVDDFRKIAGEEAKRKRSRIHLRRRSGR